jgi:hypothetical protein
MSGVRFITARDLFDAFSPARGDISTPPDDTSSLEFLQHLIDAGELQDAVGFLAYLLPRREAVWWACLSVRSFADQGLAEDAALRAAEAWVKTPEEERRQVAMDIGMQADRSRPTTWCALAAAWSGGSLTSPEQAPVPCPPYLTAQAARAAVLIGATDLPTSQRPGRLVSSLRVGIRLTEKQDGAARIVSG